MSYELFIDGRPRGQAATISGWEDLVHDLELDKDNLPPVLSRFLTRGWSDDHEELQAALSSALGYEHLTDESRSTIRGIVGMLEDVGGKIVSIAAE